MKKKRLINVLGLIGIGGLIIFGIFFANQASKNQAPEDSLASDVGQCIQKSRCSVGVYCGSGYESASCATNSQCSGDFCSGCTCVKAATPTAPKPPTGGGGSGGNGGSGTGGGSGSGENNSTCEAKNQVYCGGCIKGCKPKSRSCNAWIDLPVSEGGCATPAGSCAGEGTFPTSGQACCGSMQKCNNGRCGNCRNPDSPVPDENVPSSPGNAGSDGTPTVPAVCKGKTNDDKTKFDNTKSNVNGVYCDKCVHVGRTQDVDGKRYSCNDPNLGWEEGTVNSNCPPANQISCPPIKCNAGGQTISGSSPTVLGGNASCSYNGVSVRVGSCSNGKVNVGVTELQKQTLCKDAYEPEVPQPVKKTCDELLGAYTCPPVTCNGQTIETMGIGGSGLDKRNCYYGDEDFSAHAVSCTNGVMTYNSVVPQICQQVDQTSPEARIPITIVDSPTPVLEQCDPSVESYFYEGKECTVEERPGTIQCMSNFVRGPQWCDPRESPSSIDLSIVKKLHAQPVPEVLDPEKLSKGTYRITIPGYKNAEIAIKNDNVTIKYFLDDNADGIKQATEKFIDVKAFTVNVAKLSDLTTYKLNSGWNLIALNFVSVDFDKASELAKEMNIQGLVVVQISKYDNGNWVHFVYRINEEGKAETFGNDFNLVPGDSYFVRSLSPGAISLKGQKFTSGVPLNLNTGWNLAAILSPIDYTAQSFITKCKNEGAQCTTVSRFDSGVYESVVEFENKFFGNNFNIEDTRGYFVLNKSSNKTILP